MKHFPSSDIGLFGRRQRHARGHRIPVSIVSDASKARDNTIVLRDTFGARDVTPLPGGCSCCTVRLELQAALRRMSSGRKHVSRVVIETGEDLGPILRTFAAERALGADFYVEDFPAAALGAHGETTRFTLTEGAPLQWNAFSRFMATLMALRGPDLLHVQGLISIAGCRGPVAVQFVQHLAHPPVELQAWPDDDRTSRLAFITRGVDEKTVRALFDSVRALA